MNEGRRPAPFVSLRTPAKLNLWLKITGRRPNGYHELESLFVPISLFDEIRVREAAADRVLFQLPQGQFLDFKEDTVSRAVKIFREKIGPVPPLEWEITKNIPVSAGLGGGSSDGACALRFLAARYGGATLAKPLLERVALELGADAPFFLQSKPALVSGIGEILRPVMTEKLFFVLGRPSFGISTGEAYSWHDQETQLTRGGTLGTSGMINKVSAWQAAGQGFFSTHEIIERMHNDFEIPVIARHPEIDVMKKALRKWGALGTLMSGTGSSVYGIFGSLEASLSARESLQHEFPSHYAFFICETLA